MDSNVKNKTRVWEYIQQLNERPQQVSQITAEYCAREVMWQGPHPLDRMQGLHAMNTGYWEPLMQAFPDCRLEPYILMGGAFRGEEWVSTTGNIRAVFHNDWLGIPAHGREVSFRYGEFLKMVEGKIHEIYSILDLPELMRQAGYDVLSPCLGKEDSVSGPEAGDGILLQEQDAAETEKSLALVEAMLAGLAEYDGSGNLDSMGQERFWHSDMLWYGPHGIGTTYGLKGFQEHHQRPFLNAFPDRLGGNHVCRHSDGLYAASTGWPSLRGTHRGQYMGVAPSGKKFGMRVMDWWRREGDLLKENWVFIDLVDFFRQIGIDLFEKMRQKIERSS